MRKRRVHASLHGLTLRFPDGAAEIVPWIDLRGDSGNVFLRPEAAQRYPRTAAAKPPLATIPTVPFRRLRQRQLRRVILTSGLRLECSERALRRIAHARLAIAAL